MLEIPTFHSRYRVVRVPGDGVFFVADTAHALLPGGIYERVVSLIDGRRSCSQIAARLDGEIDLATTHYVLLRLAGAGYVEDARHRRPLAAAPPMEHANRLAEVLGADRDANVVVADHYLAPEMDHLNRSALSEGRSWAMVKIVGEEVWAGPVFVPDETPCWSCLAQWLRTTRPIDAYLERQCDSAILLSAPSPASATELKDAARTIAADGGAGERGMLFRYNRSTGALDRQEIRRRPQCPSCGDPGIYRRRLTRLDLGARDEKTVDPLGITSSVTKVATLDDRLIHVYTAAPAAVFHPSNAASLGEALRYRCVGSGTTPEHAMAAVIGETIERYSGTAHGDEPRITSTFTELGGRAIHPNACMLFSEMQYAERDAWNANGDPVTMVAEPFEPDAAIDWTPVWSVTNDDRRFLPTAFLYRGGSDLAGTAMCVADSNGCAAGQSLADATVRGFLELVERDAIALWWYQQRRRPSVDLGSLSDPYCLEIARSYDRLGRELWVLDITTDLGVPAFAAIARRYLENSNDEILFGFGAHFNAERAVTHAVTELNQLVASFDATDLTRHRLTPSLARWLADARVEEHRYLRPDGVTTLARDTFSDPWAGERSVERCREVVETRGMELLVLDQTRADASLPAVKVIVPGLRPAVRRFAPGRLHSGDESALNRIPFFL